MLEERVERGCVLARRRGGEISVDDDVLQERLPGEDGGHLGVERELVLTPLMHDSPSELAQPFDVKDWKRGECELIPGKTAPNIAVVERDKAGGRCLNYACIPAKTVLHTVEIFAAVTQDGADLEQAFTALGLRSRLQMLKPGVATPIDLAR